jgi:hypothetical protein
MAHVQIQLGVYDSSNDRGWTGLSFIGDAPTPTAITNALINYETHIDGDVETVKLTDVTDNAIDIPAMGPSKVEYTGVVILQNKTDLKKYPIEFKSIKESSIVKAGLGSQPKCSDACVADAKMFLFNMAGITVANMKLIKNYVTVQRS